MTHIIFILMISLLFNFNINKLPRSLKKCLSLISISSIVAHSYFILYLVLFFHFKRTMSFIFPGYPEISKALTALKRKDSTVKFIFKRPSQLAAINDVIGWPYP